VAREDVNISRYYQCDQIQLIGCRFAGFGHS
jgi:hypothetical protein